MSRYIDAEKLEKDGWWASRTYHQDAKTAVYETRKMTDLPTADVVEVVRCKYCKFWHREIYNGIEYFNFNSCDLNHHGDGNNFYCADGERRDDATN